ncbi:MAG: glycoside hydrolase family protein, partial [Thermosynechococcaceae cyanobacterium]
MTPSRSPNSSLRNSAEPPPPQPSPPKINPHLQKLGQIGWQQTQKLSIAGFRRFQQMGLRKPLIFGGLLVALVTLRPQLLPSFNLTWTRTDSPYPPLVMQGGDPYIRALMRTISASESNDPNPYQLLYGGTYFSDLSNHPDQCIVIVNGPNQGNCSTAAGRYQFITSTWEEKARRYHPHPEGWLFWQHYPFDPISQDRVVYNWLSDPEAWGVDISALLRDKQLDEVLYRLSGTWTSLGYGIETNT